MLDLTLNYQDFAYKVHCTISKLS